MQTFTSLEEAFDALKRNPDFDELLPFIKGIDGDFMNDLELEDFIEVFPTISKLSARRFYQLFKKSIIITSGQHVELDNKCLSVTMKVGKMAKEKLTSDQIWVKLQSKDQSGVQYLSLSNCFFQKEDLKELDILVTNLTGLKILNLSGNRIILKKSDLDEVQHFINIVKNVARFVDFSLNYFESEEWVLSVICNLQLMSKYIWILPLYFHSKSFEDPKNSGWIIKLQELKMSSQIDIVFDVHIKYYNATLKFK